MKKNNISLIALWLLVLLAYQMFGYYVVFSGMQKQAVKAVKHKLKAGVPEKDLHTIILVKNIKPKFTWVNGHELKLNGEMYDIVTSVSRNDTTFYNCIKDTEETLLFAGLNNYVQEYMSQNTDHQKKKNKLLRSVTQTYILPGEIFFPQKINFHIKTRHFLNERYMQFNISPESPPPRSFV